MIRILTDSASDILPAEAEQLGVTVIPLNVTLEDGTVLRDGIDKTPSEYYALLKECHKLPTTSQPSPELFERFYQDAAAAGDEVLGIFLSHELSGTWQCARLAADLVNVDNVLFVDSANVCLGEGLLVRLAVQLRAAGKTLVQIATDLEHAKEHLHLVAAIDDLKYLRKGGRLPAAAAVAGGMELLTIHAADLLHAVCDPDIRHRTDQTVRHALLRVDPLQFTAEARVGREIVESGEKILQIDLQAVFQVHLLFGKPAVAAVIAGAAARGALAFEPEALDQLTADAAIDHAEGVAKIHDPDLLLCVHACSSSRISLPCRALCASGAERTLQAFGPLRYFRRRCCSFRRAAAQSSARQMRRRRHAAF